MTDTSKFEQHCIVELFGHNQIAGLVTEQAIGGGSFIRVDVPKTSKRVGFTKFFGPSAIYAITPVEKAIALAMAEALNEAPIQEYRLKTIDVERQLPAPEQEDTSSADVEEIYLEHTQQSERQKAVQSARELLENKFVIFDTETTGFNSDDEIVQIAVIDQDGETIFESLIKPEQPITNHRFHGITDETVKDAPSFPEVYGAIQSALEGKLIVAYNLDYDYKMLTRVCMRHGLGPPDFWRQAGTACVMEMFAQFYGEWDAYHSSYRWKKLREALTHFRLQHEDFGEKAHDAGTDARATLAVIQNMAEWKEPSP